MWIPITLAAATFQVLRTSRQHRLRSVLSVNGAGFVRYAYGFPLALAASLVTFAVVGDDLPMIPWRFWPIIAGAGAAQILGTLALLRAFDLRDFAIGTVYAKAEVVQVAVVAAIALGEPLAPLGRLLGPRVRKLQVHQQRVVLRRLRPERPRAGGGDDVTRQGHKPSTPHRRV